MTFKYSIIASTVLVTGLAHGQEPSACRTSLHTNIPQLGDQVITASDPENPPIIFEVGEIEGSLGAEPYATMSGGVLLRRGDSQAGADTARYIPESRALRLEGNVLYADKGTQVDSDLAEFNYDTGEVRFEGAEFSLGASAARGAAEGVRISENGTLSLDGVSYTTCPPDSNDWLLEADDIDLDTREGVGTAQGIKLRFQGVPILYAPYISFPIGDARKSGILTPEFGTTRRGGNDIRVPYYFNLAPNYDATITPRLLTDRGFQLQNQFRYLTERMEGQLNADYLASDNMFNDSRYYYAVEHRMQLPRGWRNQIDFQNVSDSQYFEDLGGSLSRSSITHLNRSISIDYYTEHVSLFGQFQDFQTIDDAITATDRPYRRVPQLLASGYWPDQLLGLSLGFDGELVNFDRDTGVTGWRMNVSPEVSLPLTGPGWFITPKLAYDVTQYQLSNTLAGQDDEPNRALPIASLDLGVILERNMRNASRIQTIEPRLLYAHVPFRDQADLPVFDTITPDLNLIQLFRNNRFLGVDRIADTDQISIGVTSRILDVSTGKELVSATIGQTRYLSNSGVTLPGQPVVTTESSDYIAEIGFLLNENLNFDIGHQWGESGSGTTQSEARLQYRPATNKILNLAYRFRRDSLEQGDVSWAWPIAKNWNFVGRYNYSFRDREALEQFYGLEYESCCWGLRLVSRRHISTRDGTQDSSIGLQLVLKGMSSVGTAADKLLERGILGYSADLR
ncbi:MAG: LPS assembly protein LptD [Pseudomonadota bacterium]